MPIPSTLHRYFWDVDPELLDSAKHERPIIERLLEKGDMESVRWMLKTYDQGRVADVVRVSRSLSPKSRNFWQLFLKITPSNPKIHA